MSTLAQNNVFPIIKNNDDKTFRVEIASTPDLIDQAFSLRYKVFNLELGEGLKESHLTQRDTDRYDPFCDHLIVVDESQNLVVGTYRIMRYENAIKNIGFYSETEFDLTNIYKQLPYAAEIGRCCVHAEYRSGLVMNLLWYGLASYMKANNVSHLFGCTSMNKGDTGEQAALIYKVCQASDAIAEERYWVKPQPGFEVKGFDRSLELPKTSGNPKRLLPSLLRGYLTVGVQICGEPAYDPEFGVIDFFTLFDFKGIAKAAERFLPK